MKTLIATIGAASFLATAAFAADVAPLPSGKPAGVTKAQGLLDNTPLLVGLGVVAIVAVVVATDNDDSTVVTGTTATST
jgi:hypothetical protein